MTYVSANFLDRSSPTRWLRWTPKQDTAKSASPTEALVCTDVKLEKAPAGISGFGCSTIASCASTRLLKDRVIKKRPGRKLIFSGFSFFDNETHSKISEMAKLYLWPDGSMTYDAKAD